MDKNIVYKSKSMDEAKSNNKVQGNWKGKDKWKGKGNQNKHITDNFIYKVTSYFMRDMSPEHIQFLIESAKDKNNDSLMDAHFEFILYKLTNLKDDISFTYDDILKKSDSYGFPYTKEQLKRALDMEYERWSVELVDNPHIDPHIDIQNGGYQNIFNLYHLYIPIAQILY